MKEIKIENDRYFRIRLKNEYGLSIHETKNLSPNKYHPIDTKDTSNYQILVEVKETVGEPFYSLNVFPESYQTYEFQNITHQIINDYDIDGFLYDKERKVICYEWISGIYTISDGNNFYDVVTDKAIPMGVIGSISEVETVSEFSDMITDLQCIEKHKDLYKKIMDEILSKLLIGMNNKVLAQNQYIERFNTMKKLSEEKIAKSEEYYKKQSEILKIENRELREKVGKILCRIKNDVK